jgi:hypothetical protein
MNGMFRPGTSIIIVEPLSQGVSGDADNRIDLRIKGFRAAQSVHCNAVFFDLVDGAFEIFFANECEKSNRVVSPPKYTGRQNVLYFSPFGLKFAGRPFQVLPPRERSLRPCHPIFEVSITEFFAARHWANHL